MAGDGFKRIVRRLPYPWEKILGMGISYFISEQDPENVKFKVHVDDSGVKGWSIQVATDKDNTEEAKDFWENYVDPMFGGAEE